MPYLGLRARISLAWLAYPILIIILILIQLFLTLGSVGDGVLDAKRDLAASCAGFEGAASVAASIPHFMAQQTNEFIVSSAENIVHGLATVLDLSIRAIEAIILYIVDTYRSLYLCLAEFVVRGSLALLISAAEEAEKVFADAVSGLRTAIPEATIGGAESLLSDTIKTLDKIPGVKIPQPNLQIPDLTALQNVKVPTGLSDALTQLNSSLPTLNELRDALDKVISTPFEALRVEVASNLKNATIDRTLLKIPPRQTVTFCQDLDTSFLDKVGDVISSGLKLIILLLCIVILIIFLFNVFKERFLYKRMINKVDEAREVWLYGSQETFSSSNLLAFTHNVQNPFASTMNNKLLKTKTPKSYRLPWFLAYITWPSALLFLGFGLLGFLVIQVQLFALHGVRHQAVHQANSGVNDMTNLLADKINDQTRNASAAFAEDTNAVILKFQSDVNDHMLGWAGTTTTTLNNTLTTFYDGLTTVVSDTFGKTPLKGPSLELLNCLIGSKVAGIQSALTFVHDHAHVELPTVSPTALMISPSQTQDLVGSVGSPQNDSSSQSNQTEEPSLATRFVDRLINRYTKALLKQRVTYIALLACYLLVIIFGIIGVIWDMLKHRNPTSSIRDSIEIQENQISKRGLGSQNQVAKDSEFHPDLRKLNGIRNGKSFSFLPPVALVSSPFSSIHSQPSIQEREESIVSNQVGSSFDEIDNLPSPILEPFYTPEPDPFYPYYPPLSYPPIPYPPIPYPPVSYSEPTSSSNDMNSSYPNIYQQTAGPIDPEPSNNRAIGLGREISKYNISYPKNPKIFKPKNLEIKEIRKDQFKEEPKSRFSPITPLSHEGKLVSEVKNDLRNPFSTPFDGPFER
ncbi:uncharacterized protein MELLADRAFT_85972 [Melampsora larici-populina 98AG31]|uniref:Plasma membrane fusion protein PRM1 n=1 Tax=Melampsora larici-populina (strain 98AG31 / pathotype 3-4-7) TaxID=747676 RepID=F4RKB8_MELLP|nr:uncharacterized protein MELLADRAFT_85972 [Melampsora larici-populina 98AG31]EGG07065.1 hypothetical protein MELLADRAFT_85972 [Melampsora larici-populina 98AG31]